MTRAGRTETRWEAGRRSRGEWNPQTPCLPGSASLESPDSQANTSSPFALWNSLDLAGCGKSHTKSVSPSGFFQRLPPGWNQRERAWGRNPIPSGLPGMATGNVPTVLGNDLGSQGLCAALSLRACTPDVSRGWQEPRKGHHLELTVARTRGGQGRDDSTSGRPSCPVCSESRLGQQEGSHLGNLLVQSLSQPSSHLPPDQPFWAWRANSTCSLLFVCWGSEVQSVAENLSANGPARGRLGLKWKCGSELKTSSFFPAFSAPPGAPPGSAGKSLPPTSRGWKALP